MSNDVLSMMEEDVSGAQASSIEQRPALGRVAELAREIREKEKTVDNYEEAAKKAKAELLKLTDEDLPALMAELGLKSFKLDDGSTVEVKPTYGGHIKAENKPAAFEWLRDHNYGDIIKNVVSVNFGAGEDDKAHEFIMQTSAQGYVPEQKTDVNAMTLKAWVRERVESGDEFPMALFGAFVGQRAVVKSAKKGK
jgi:hypothetical protein